MKKKPTLLKLTIIITLGVMATCSQLSIVLAEQPVVAENETYELEHAGHLTGTIGAPAPEDKLDFSIVLAEQSVDAEKTNIFISSDGKPGPTEHAPILSETYEVEHDNHLTGTISASMFEDELALLNSRTKEFIVEGNTSVQITYDIDTIICIPQGI